MFEFTLSD